MILGILPQGYIYPKKDRPVRDLARKRMFLVQHKTAHTLSLQSLIARCCAKKISSNQMRHLTRDDLQHLLEEEHLVLCAQANTSPATKALSNKLARICYYIMRDNVPFREQLSSQ
jgi:hypothetical protein